MILIPFICLIQHKAAEVTKEEKIGRIVEDRLQYLMNQYDKKLNYKKIGDFNTEIINLAKNVLYLQYKYGNSQEIQMYRAKKKSETEEILKVKNEKKSQLDKSRESLVNLLKVKETVPKRTLDTAVEEFKGALRSYLYADDTSYIYNYDLLILTNGLFINPDTTDLEHIKNGILNLINMFKILFEDIKMYEYDDKIIQKKNDILSLETNLDKMIKELEECLRTNR